MKWGVAEDGVKFITHLWVSVRVWTFTLKETGRLGRTYLTYILLFFFFSTLYGKTHYN